VWSRAGFEVDVDREAVDGASLGVSVEALADAVSAGLGRCRFLGAMMETEKHDTEPCRQAGKRAEKE
jgi:hypothetical protein